MFYISNSILFYNNNYFFLLWNLHTFQIIRGGLDTHSCHRFLPASTAPSEVKGFCLRHNHTWTKRKQKQQNIGSWEVKELKQLWEKHRSNLLWATKPWKGFRMRGSRYLWKWGLVRGGRGRPEDRRFGWMSIWKHCPGERNGNLLPYSCLENSIDRGIHVVTNRICLSYWP